MPNTHCAVGVLEANDGTRPAAPLRMTAGGRSPPRRVPLRRGLRSLLGRVPSLILPGRDLANHQKSHNCTRDFDEVREDEQTAERLKLIERLILLECHTRRDIPDKAGDQEKRPPPADQRRCAELVAGRWSAG